MLFRSSHQPLRSPTWHYDCSKFLDAIYQRRSARCFRKAAISLAEYRAMMSALSQPIATHSQEAIAIYAVVHRVTGLAPGLYRDGELLQGGDFSAKVAYLCVNQRIAGDGAVTFFLAAHPQNYQTAMQMAGVLGQQLYLAST